MGDGGTVGVSIPRWTGYTEDEKAEAEQLQTRLRELEQQAEERAKDNSGLRLYDAQRANGVALKIRALGMTPKQYAALVRSVREAQIREALESLVRYHDDADYPDVFAFIEGRAFPPAAARDGASDGA